MTSSLSPFGIEYSVFFCTTFIISNVKRILNIAGDASFLVVTLLLRKKTPKQTMKDTIKEANKYIKTYFFDWRQGKVLVIAQVSIVCCVWDSLSVAHFGDKQCRSSLRLEVIEFDLISKHTKFSQRRPFWGHLLQGRLLRVELIESHPYILLYEFSLRRQLRGRLLLGRPLQGRPLRVRPWLGRPFRVRPF